LFAPAAFIAPVAQDLVVQSSPVAGSSSGAGPLCGAGFIKDVALTLQRSMPFPVALVE
jgi:hypothetical protein